MPIETGFHSQVLRNKYQLKCMSMLLPFFWGFTVAVDLSTLVICLRFNAAEKPDSFCSTVVYSHSPSVVFSFFLEFPTHMVVILHDTVPTIMKSVNSLKLAQAYHYTNTPS